MWRASPRPTGTYPRKTATPTLWTAVHVQGVAPDAQLLTMKVFGKNGGAYDSDYMAAIEDAILLGCDAVNLSLGSTSPGYAQTPSTRIFLDRLSETDPWWSPLRRAMLAPGLTAFGMAICTATP